MIVFTIYGHGIFKYRLLYWEQWRFYQLDKMIAQYIVMDFMATGKWIKHHFRDNQIDGSWKPRHVIFTAFDKQHIKHNHWLINNQTGVMLFTDKLINYLTWMVVLHKSTEDSHPRHVIDFSWFQMNLLWASNEVWIILFDALKEILKRLLMNISKKKIFNKIRK